MCCEDSYTLATGSRPVVLAAFYLVHAQYIVFVFDALRIAQQMQARLCCTKSVRPSEHARIE